MSKRQKGVNAHQPFGMEGVATEEATKQVTWLVFALTHVPAFGSGGFLVAVLIFIFRWIRNPRLFLCTCVGWTGFAATLLYLWSSRPDPLTKSG